VRKADELSLFDLLGREIVLSAGLRFVPIQMTLQYVDMYNMYKDGDLVLASTHGDALYSNTPSRDGVGIFQQ
jgi:hypothetical protein